MYIYKRIPEASFSYAHVFDISLPFEEWFGGIVEETVEWKICGNLARWHFLKIKHHKCGFLIYSSKGFP